MIYINPYIANVTGMDHVRQNQFKEGSEKGYFLKNKDGDVYLMYSLSIEFAIIDLTNPKAREWTKNIIKKNMIDEGKAWGWMHDFGEYTPFDAVAFDGTDPFLNHNDYPK